MAKHRAIIIGAGRIGAGYKWPQHPYVYTHADAYLKLKERVDLDMFIETDRERGLAATEKYKIPASGRLLENLETGQYDIVSVCVPPDQQEAVLREVGCHESVRGIWCEKPWMLKTVGSLDGSVKVQVNYIRRFDTLHNSVKGEIDKGTLGELVALVVMAKNGPETLCHFEDLSRWWNVQLKYIPVDGVQYVNTEYELIGTEGKVRFFQGGMSAQLYGTKESQWFPGSYVPDSKGQIAAKEPKIFMELALSNLLDAVEGKAELKSPPY